MQAQTVRGVLDQLLAEEIGTPEAARQLAALVRSWEADWAFSVDLADLRLTEAQRDQVSEMMQLAALYAAGALPPEKP